MPVVCTGNDFSTLYAPLIRDGRMEKFYWAPTREDRVGVCMGIFQHDGVTRGEVETIVDTFPGQSIDFFGALRVSQIHHMEAWTCMCRPAIRPIHRQHPWLQPCLAPFFELPVFASHGKHAWTSSP